MYFKKDIFMLEGIYNYKEILIVIKFLEFILDQKKSLKEKIKKFILLRYETILKFIKSLKISNKEFSSFTFYLEKEFKVLYSTQLNKDQSEKNLYSYIKDNKKWRDLNCNRLQKIAFIVRIFLNFLEHTFLTDNEMLFKNIYDFFYSQFIYSSCIVNEYYDLLEINSSKFYDTIANYYINESIKNIKCLILITNTNILIIEEKNKNRKNKWARILFNLNFKGINSIFKSNSCKLILNQGYNIKISFENDEICNDFELKLKIKTKTFYEMEKTFLNERFNILNTLLQSDNELN